MTQFNMLTKQNNNYYINSRVAFSPVGIISSASVKEVFNFSYLMTFGQEGEHRNHRTGGEHRRRKGEIFANAFQGKLAEYAMYDILTSKNINVNSPDLQVYGLGKWDSVDLMIGNVSISIKSTKSFGNLLLLEKEDWDAQANYLPNGHSYDYTFLIRMSPFCEDIMKRNRLLYSDIIDKNHLEKTLLSEKWGFDVPGFITKSDLINIINCKHIIPQGSFLNGKTKMDASNYYVQSGDLRKFDSFILDIL